MYWRHLRPENLGTRSSVGVGAGGKKERSKPKATSAAGRCGEELQAACKCSCFLLTHTSAFLKFCPLPGILAPRPAAMSPLFPGSEHLPSIASSSCPKAFVEAAYQL